MAFGVKNLAKNMQTHLTIQLRTVFDACFSAMTFSLSPGFGASLFQKSPSSNSNELLGLGLTSPPYSPVPRFGDPGGRDMATLNSMRCDAQTTRRLVEREAGQLKNIDQLDSCGEVTLGLLQKLVI